MKKFTAFTLTEIMITVGIIGVISALTVPTLIKNYQAKANVLQLRKIVTEIESAVDLLITEEGKPSFGTTTIGRNGGVDTFIRNHFKINKTCAAGHTRDCFASENYISINGRNSRSFSCSGNAYLLANSAAICANKIDRIDLTINKNGSMSSSESAFKTVRGLNVELFIDTNGPQGPNIGGRDMFHVYIQPDGRIYDQANADDIVCQDSASGPLIPITPGGGGGFGNPVCLFPDSFEVETEECLSSAFGAGCFANIINSNWEMNY